GHGSFGIIRKCLRVADSKIICRKEINYSKMSQKEKEQLQAELSILRGLHHPNIVEYFEREHKKETADLNIYMEYCGNGDLGKHIKNLKLRNQYAPEEFVWSIFSQLVDALYRCHYGENPPEAGTNLMGLGEDAKPKIKSKQQPYMILHRDLKPENVFLGADNSVKLGDFGLSKIMSSHDFASTYVGTPFYMSPEICASERYTLFSDIWGLGCIMYELCTKEPPFNARSHLELIQKIKLGKFTPLPSFYSQELQNVISSCLKVNPNHRPDTAHLLNLPIVKLMRKAQEVTRIGSKAVLEKEEAIKTLEEIKTKMLEIEENKTKLHDEMDGALRRRWEVKAHLEIDRRVALALQELRKGFDEEVNKRVARELERRLASTEQKEQDSSNPSWRIGDSSNTAPSSSPLSSTPELKTHISHPTVSQGTAASADDDFPSSTDISSLSLDSPIQSKASSSATSNPTNLQACRPTKRSSRTPLTRAQTMIEAPSGLAAFPSPADIEMAEPSPMSIEGLSLSPRRTGVVGILPAPEPPKRHGNIFSKAAAASRHLEPISADSDSDDSDAALSPTPANASRPSSPTTNLARTHLTSVLPPSTATSGDPFKPVSRSRPGLIRQRTIAAPQRTTAGNAPGIFEAAPSKAAATRPVSGVPVVATSPSRPRTLAAGAGSSDHGSPMRRAGNQQPVQQQQQHPQQGKKKHQQDTEELVRRVHRHNLHGRTLVELAQERVAPTAKTAASKEREKEKEDQQRPTGPLIEEKKPHLPAVWDPERDEMPSPFLVRGQKPVMAIGKAAWR
ncbi:kinase-like protein, partial [Viridothelium virens]